jgi:hypothetical protein
VRIATDELLARLKEDPEFGLTARLWDCRIRFRMGAEGFILVIRDGEATAVVEPVGIFDDWQIAISADDEVWGNILAAVPPPFFHDLFPAQLHHGLRMEGDLESLFAYYGAVRRLTEVMRSVHNDAPAAIPA